MAEVIDLFYDIFRVLSIAYNIVMIALIFREVRGYKSNNPAMELVKRLVYYPFVQIITFIPALWYAFGYDIPNVDIDDYYNQTSDIVIKPVTCYKQYSHTLAVSDSFWCFYL